MGDTRSAARRLEDSRAVARLREREAEAKKVKRWADGTPVERIDALRELLGPVMDQINAGVPAIYNKFGKEIEELVQLELEERKRTPAKFETGDGGQQNYEQNRESILKAERRDELQRQIDKLRAARDAIK